PSGRLIISARNPKQNPVMNRANTESPTQAFETTDYHVRANNEWHTVNIGQDCPDALRAWLTRHCNGPCAWIITAYNPHAKQVDTADNQRCDAALKAWLDSTAHHYTAASNVTQHGDWPAEPGVCILDM